MSGIIEGLEALAVQYGYPGVFLISLAGSVVPFVPLPYLVVVVLLSGSTDPLLLGIAAGAGGAVGKLTSYYLGRLGYIATGEKAKRNLDAMHSIMAKYGMLGVFVFAATPLPDDVYVIPMGILKLPFSRFFIANLAGKVLLSLVVAYGGRAYFSYTSAFLGAGSATTLVVAAALTAVVSVIVIRSDWVMALEIAHTKGIRELLRSLRQVLHLW